MTEKNDLGSLARRGALKLNAAYSIFSVYFRTAMLELRNRTSHAPVTGNLDVLLSMTTFGYRTDTVHVAIESILRGKHLPRRAILWLDEHERFDNLPKALIRLQNRGLEIRLTKNYGPHKKLYPIATTAAFHTTPIVTCDDDVLYPRGWLLGLFEAYRAHPSVINGFRARVMSVDGQQIAPYDSWPLCATTDPSFRHLLTNVSGNIYPPHFVDIVRDSGDAFLSVSASADDLWLHHLALRHDIRIRQIRPDYWEFPVIPGSQKSSLYDQNVTRGENDRVIRRLYATQDFEKLIAEKSSSAD